MYVRENFHSKGVLYSSMLVDSYSVKIGAHPYNIGVDLNSITSMLFELRKKILNLENPRVQRKEPLGVSSHNGNISTKAASKKIAYF